MGNPFAPPRPRRAPQSEPDTGQATAELTRTELEELRKPELQELAAHAGVSDEGTKAELVERLTGA